MKHRRNNDSRLHKIKKTIVALITTITILLMILAINVYAASTGINTELNESAIVRLSGAIAMGNNTDRIVTRDAVASVLSGYNIGSSVVTVTDDVTNDFIIVKYSATSREYRIDKNTIYTITYNANGGSGAPASQEHKHNESTTLSTTEPTRSNYRFRGWSTSSTATEATYAAGGTYTTNGDVTLYAVWQAMYTVSYNANNGSGAPASQIKYHDETLTLQTGTPTRSNYRFRGWSTSSSATSAEYQPGGSFTTNANTTLYAVWQAIYTITYHANGGSGAPLAQTKYHGESITLSTTTPTRSNYRFRGWSTSNSATSATYGAGATYSEEGNATLYAVWQAMYTVTYNANGGSGAPGSQTKYHGEPLTLQTGTPTRSNYTFLGWSESSTATSATYSAGSSFTTDANTTLYAVWRANTITITFNDNGGSGGPGTQTMYYGVATNLSSTTPTRTGYAFKGWGWSASAGVSYAAGASYTGHSDATLYAVWELITYTVSFNANGGSGAPSAQTKTHDVTLTLSSTKPTRSGCTFLGWSTNSGATSPSYSAGGSFTTNANTTLYAVWIATTTSFGYTGGVQYFTAPVAGTYQLKVWGAKGGDANSVSGGYGGYAVGNVYLSANQTIYIVVGGAGSKVSRGSGVSGGYNGGGAAFSYANYGGGTEGTGGGATHVATSNRGVLSNYSSYRSEVLIVAGGGGGGLTNDGFYWGGEEEWYDSPGGSGGGTNGGIPVMRGWENQDGSPATQTSGNAFGQGGCRGGGGYYGGYGPGDTHWSGGGGSGYIGGVSNGSMSNGVQNGNGYAQVIVVSI